MDDTNPKDVAFNMIACRGIQAAYDRCEGIVSGRIKSGISKDFWKEVLVNIEKER